MMRAILAVFLGIWFVAGVAQHTRIQAGFSLKEKNADGTSNLTMGTVYYDKAIGKIVYDITFPSKEVLVMQDTNMYRIVPGKPAQRTGGMDMVGFSIFALALNGNLPYYGLQKTPFVMGTPAKEGDLVITEWLPPAKAKEKVGKMVVSQQNKQLFGLVSYTPNGEILAKQFFRGYTQVQGLSFPAEIVQLLYTKGKEQKKITTYRDIHVNQLGDDAHYNYPVPAH